MRSSVFFFFFGQSFGNPVKERCRKYSETVFSLSTFIVGFTLFYLFDFIFLEYRQHVHWLSWCVKTLFTSFYQTDDIDRINDAIQQWKTMGKISARGFIKKNKKFVKVQSWPLSAFTYFIGNSSFTSVMWRWVFLKVFYVQ